MNGAAVTTASAKKAAKSVESMGINACKGQSANKTSSNACKGQPTCSISRRGPCSVLPRFPQTKGGEHEVRPEQETILVWRNDGQVFHRTVEADERLAYLEARRGKTLGDICTLLEFQNADKKITWRVASFLADWFRDGLVSRVSVVA
jgi:hypothetical protein